MPGAPARAVLFVDVPHSDLHQPGLAHPDSPARLEAVRRAASRVAGLEHRDARRAEFEELATVHTDDYIRWIQRLSASGGGHVDPDTVVSAGSFEAACEAAGAGPTAFEELAGRIDLAAAFVATRPPGHHASRERGAGFCIFNNIAVAAARLIGNGERVLILDWDAHHGDGTAEIFWREPDVLYVSIHEEGLYPGTGWPDERGSGAGNLTTVNLPLPGGATGDVYLELLDTVVEPIVDRFGPSWVLVSAGFDAHVADPLTDLALEARDYAHLAVWATSLVPRSGRTIFFLEGGYHLVALEESTGAVLEALTNPGRMLEETTRGGPGRLRIAELSRLWAR